MCRRLLQHVCTVAYIHLQAVQIHKLHIGKTEIYQHIYEYIYMLCIIYYIVGYCRLLVVKTTVPHIYNIY